MERSDRKVIRKWYKHNQWRAILFVVLYSETGLMWIAYVNQWIVETGLLFSACSALFSFFGRSLSWLWRNLYNEWQKRKFVQIINSPVGRVLSKHNSPELFSTRIGERASANYEPWLYYFVIEIASKCQKYIIRQNKQCLFIIRD